MSICPAVLDKVDRETGDVHFVIHPKYLADVLGAMQSGYSVAYANERPGGGLRVVWRFALHEHPSAIIADVPKESIVDAMNEEVQ